MHHSTLAALSGAAAALALLPASALATDYYVAPSGNNDADGSAATPFATIDKAITSAENASDVIHVAPGTYSTTTQYGPNLKAKLVGTGASRDDVIIQSAGTYRTLRMAADSWLENVTVVGEGTYKADKGGAIEMSGGTVTNCVVRDGTAYGNDSKNAGGNLYLNANGAIVVDCVISGGTSKNRGGNVCLDHGTLRNCTISGGSIPEKRNDSAEQHGGNVWTYQGRIENCTITGGSAERAGNVYLYDAAATLADSTVSGGTGDNHGGNVFQRNGTVTNCVVSGGVATAAAGGNIHVQNGAILDSTVSGGTAGTSGGNVYMTGGTVSDTTIRDGTSLGTGWDQGGGNVFMNPGRLTRCRVSGGVADGNRGGGIRSRNANSVVEDCLVYGNPGGGVCLEGKGTHYNNTVVANGAYGVWGYGSNPGTFANCIFYGNTNGLDLAEWTGNHPAASDLYNCAFGQAFLKGSVDIRDYAGSVHLVDSGAFVDYANGDYHAVSGSALEDAGASDNRADASTLDLDRNPRQSGVSDIGCYEIQKSDMTVTFALASALERLYAPVEATFEASALNAPGAIRFIFDFGDGSQPVTTNGTAVSHVFAEPGSYDVTVTAVSGGATARLTRENCVSLVSRITYVTQGNPAAAFPYDTPETGYATFAAAFAAAVEGSEIRVCDGVYEQSAEYVVDKAVSIVGNDADPGAVVLRNTATATTVAGNGIRRVMNVTSAGAFVSGLTMENGQVYNECGGNLLLAGGTVSNCVIRGGLVKSAWWGMGGGVRLNSGTLTHCIVSNNVVEGTATGDWQHGAAVAFPYGSSGKLLNSLVAYNRYVPTDDGTAKDGTAGLVFNGNTAGSLVENCTVAANRVDGRCTTDGAGIKCDWNTRVRNTAVALNVVATYVDGEEETSEKISSIAVVEGHDAVNTCATDDNAPVNATCLAGTPAQLFKNYAKGDFTPTAGGLLYDRGTAPLIAASVDLAGRPRVQFLRIDVGCYECPFQPATIIVVR